jgi:quercetin dioxygenase-like cupin family protein
MQTARLEDMVRGWFVGDFEPSVVRTEACEVAVQHYAAGADEPRHVHKIATEVTVVVSGRVVMLEREWGPGDIIVTEPGEPTSFRALTDAVTVAVKMPSVLGDKYILDPS